ncbi:MAG: TIGR04282 family arsenosugar biosynthesis glycosyltransferase [Elusimicrobia bacterium]|nr:TIGR04282 family arsenosugar biosynthesis glycosyltransferase [Elusimicrobiota bacterium]
MNSLILFVKAPVPGKVKTRLQIPLSASQVARVYEAFVRDTVACARLTSEAAVSIAYEPHPERPGLAWLEDAPPWFPQAEGDLGARLVAAFDKAFRAGAEKVVVIGSDCPDLEPDILRQAFARLDDVQAVLGPAEDGGYYLIGLRAPMPRLFAKMEWSGPDVLNRTLERLRGESFRLLSVRSDVDTFGDLKALARRLFSGESAAPHSRAAIQDLIIEDLLRMPVGDGVDPWTGERNERGGSTARCDK